MKKIALIVPCVLMGCSRPAASDGPTRTQTETTSASQVATALPTCSNALDALRARLGTRHQAPTPVQLKTVCDHPVPALIQIAEGPSERDFHRLRAVNLLSQYPDSSATQTLTQMVTKGSTPSLRRTALLALSGSPTREQQARQSALSALQDEDPHVRVAAARIAAKDGSPKLTSALKQAQAREQEAFVRKAMDDLLAQPAAAPR